MSLVVEKFNHLGNAIAIIHSDHVFEQDIFRFLAHPSLGVGFDQCIVIHSVSLVVPQQAKVSKNAKVSKENEDSKESEVSISIINADGSMAGQCLNGMLALGAHLLQKYPTILLYAVYIGKQKNFIQINNDNMVMVYLPYVPFAFSSSSNTYYAQKQQWKYRGTDYVWGACDVGNPHAILQSATDPFTLSRNAFALLCKNFLKDHDFPEGVNISLAYFDPPEALEHTIRLRTYERGVGETLACGSAAAAAVAIGVTLFGRAEQQSIYPTFGTFEVLVMKDAIALGGKAARVLNATLKWVDIDIGCTLLRELEEAMH